LALVHRRLAQQGIGRFFGEILRGHGNALGAVDPLAFLERGARALELVPQTGEGVEARDAEIEDILDALLAQAPDDVGGDAGVDGGLDRGLVALIDEHGDGSLHRPADLEHLLEHVAARVLEGNQDDVGVDGVDASEQVRGLAQSPRGPVARLAQAVLQDRRADRILIDDDDVERRLHGRRRQFSSSVPSSLERGFLSPINSLSAKPLTARRSAGAPMVEYWAAALSKDAAPTPQRSNVHRGCFPPAAESRLYICALVFAGCSAGAPTQLGRTRRGSEQGVARMGFHADLHGHSKPSGATSRDLDRERLAAGACRKGIGVAATGDFPHPAWCAELKQKLVPAEPGLYRLRGDIEQAIAQTLPPACRASV